MNALRLYTDDRNNLWLFYGDSYSSQIGGIFCPKDSACNDKNDAVKARAVVLVNTVPSNRESEHDVKRCIRLVLIFAVVIITLFSAAAVADECFSPSRKLNGDAQTIRLKAMDRGWKVGETVSHAAATVGSGKSDIYPTDNVEICLREENNTLQIADILFVLFQWLPSTGSLYV